MRASIPRRIDNRHRCRDMRCRLLLTWTIAMRPIVAQGRIPRRVATRGGATGPFTAARRMRSKVAWHHQCVMFVRCAVSSSVGRSSAGRAAIVWAHCSGLNALNDFTEWRAWRVLPVRQCPQAAGPAKGLAHEGHGGGGSSKETEHLSQVQADRQRQLAGTPGRGAFPNWFNQSVESTAPRITGVTRVLLRSRAHGKLRQTREPHPTFST